MKYDYESYKKGKEAFNDLLCDYNISIDSDFYVGVLHACLEWIEELDVGDGVVRTLTDHGTGLTGHLM